MLSVTDNVTDHGLDGLDYCEEVIGTSLGLKSVNMERSASLGWWK